MKNAFKLLLMNGKNFPFPYSQDFSINNSLSRWRIPGYANIVGGTLVITPTLLGELSTDPGFEIWTNASTLTNWAKTTSGTSTLSQEGTVKHGDSWAAKLTVDAGGDNVYIKQTCLTVGVWFRASVWAKADSINGAPSFRLGDLTTAPLIPLTTTYTQYSISQRAANVAAYIGRGSANGRIIYADGSSFQAISLSTTGMYYPKPHANYRVLVLPGTTILGNSFGLWYAVDNPNNPQNGIAAYHDGVNKLYFTKRLGGTVTDIIAPTTVTYNANSKIEVRGVGTTLQLFYGGVQQGSDTMVSNDATINGAYCGIFSSYQGNTIKSFELLTNP
jgi:hypothetical protein